MHVHHVLTKDQHLSSIVDDLLNVRLIVVSASRRCGNVACVVWRQLMLTAGLHDCNHVSDEVFLCVGEHGDAGDLMLVTVIDDVNEHRPRELVRCTRGCCGQESRCDCRRGSVTLGWAARQAHGRPARCSLAALAGGGSRS